MPANGTTDVVAHAGWELRPGSGGAAILTLSGRLEAPVASRLWREIEQGLQSPPPSALQVDASRLEHCDGAGVALLQFLQMGHLTSGGTVTIQGLPAAIEKLLRDFTPEDYARWRPQPPPKTGQIEELGAVFNMWRRDVRDQIAFLGEIARSFAATVVRPRQMRWPEVWRVFELAGVNALPIVSLISLLVGLIIAFESAGPFKMFGAEIFIANMIGIVMARELGPLMTAILLAGRSGSAFAAELGTMKVNEELNALETMGLDPVRFLVVQRVAAGILLTPLLTVYSIGIGIFGGVLVMLSMGFPITIIWQQMAMTLHAGDLGLGVLKGVVFGAIVATVGCLRGLQTKQGPAAVGQSTTRAVVSSILLVIVADAVFSVLTFAL